MRKNFKFKIAKSSFKHFYNILNSKPSPIQIKDSIAGEFMEPKQAVTL